METLYFTDNKRTIDYILVYTDDEDSENKLRRKTYEQNLVDEGLELEKEDKSVCFVIGQNTHSNSNFCCWNFESMGAVVLTFL